MDFAQDYQSYSEKEFAKYILQQNEYAVFLSYRNKNGVDTVEIPRSLPTNPLVTSLGLFNEPGYLPVFDQTLVAAQKRLLHLARPLKSKPVQDAIKVGN